MKIDIRNLTELNNTMYAAAAYVTEMESWWKRQLEGKFKELSCRTGKRNITKKHKDRLERRYNIRRKRLNIVREKIKQRIKAVGAKIKRFNSRINQYQPNQCLSRIKDDFLKQLNNEEGNHQCEIPNSVEAQNFWRGI